MRKTQKYLFCLGVIAVLGLSGCDGGDEEKDCGADFVPTCIPDDNGHANAMQLRCSASGVIYRKACSEGCETIDGKDICKGETFCGVCGDDEYCDYDTCRKKSDQVVTSCHEDGDCASSASGHYCDQASKTCVQCLNAGNCGDESLYVCENNACRKTGCAVNGDCAANTTDVICNTETHKCVACVTESDCGDASLTCENGKCNQKAPTGCQSDSDCASSSNGKVCDTANHVCVQCTAGNAAACTGDKSVCNTASHSCVQCVAPSDCGNANVYACNANKCEKTGCEADTDCASSADGHYCKTDSYKCVECLTTDNCLGGYVCEANKCEEKACTADEDCADSVLGHACDTTAQKCVECTSNNASACTGSTAVCNEAVHACVQCTADQADACTGDTAMCNAAKNICVECVTDEQCTNPDAPVCHQGKCSPDPDAKVETCAALTITSTTDACERTGSGDTIILRGNVLTPDSTYEGGSVVIKNGKISYVGCEPEGLDTATVITCPSAVISPGLVNGHDHITYSNPASPDSWADERFDHRTDWRKSRNGHTNHNGKGTDNNMVGELRQLMSGTTAVFGSVGSENFSGLIRNIDSEGIGNVVTDYETFPIGKNEVSGKVNDQKDGNQEKSGCSKFQFVKGTKQMYGPHIGEGINDVAINELRCFSGEGQDAQNFFDKTLSIIHGVAADAKIIQKMADADTKLIWSPRSNVSLYGDTAIAPMYDSLGVTIALGTDWVYSGSMNMLRELQCVDYLNHYHYDDYFTDYQMWMMATYNGAAAFGVADIYGNLKENAIADIAIYREKDNRKLHRAVIDAEPQDVLLVMMDGAILYGDANIVTDANSEDVTVCDSAKKIRMGVRPYVHSGNKENPYPNFTYAALSGMAKYDLFTCGTPKKEPTCIPMRPRGKDTLENGKGTSQYGAQSYASFSSNPGEPESNYYSDPKDIDGDGIPNKLDNCPFIFNPVRPQDNPQTTDLYDEQVDMDGDGIGDVCDAYPTCAANDDTCPNPKDRDGDGIPNRQDLCPDDADPDNLDGDGDGVGDVCDKCIDDPNNEDGKGCPYPVTVIQTIRNAHIAGTLKDGDFYKTQGVVTAIVNNYAATATSTKLNGFIIQNEDAGIYIYSATEAAKVKEGDNVTVYGTATPFNGLLEITPTKVVVDSHDNPLPAPKPISAKRATSLCADENDTTCADTTSKNPYDAVLVSVSGLTIGDLDKTTSNAPVYVCSDSSGTTAYVDDFIMGTALFDALIDSIGGKGVTADFTGILTYEGSDKRSKIAPRNADDIIAKFGIKELTSDFTEADWGSNVDVTVTLTGKAESDTVINIAYGTENSSVTIVAGETSATFQVTMASTGDTTVTATYGTQTKSITIKGNDPAVGIEVVSLDSDAAAVAVGTSKTFKATLNKPAKSDTVLTLTPSVDWLTVTPSAVVEGSKELGFSVAVAETATIGTSGTVSVAIGSQEAKTLTITAAKNGWEHTEDFENEKISENITSYSKDPVEYSHDGFTVKAKGRMDALKQNKSIEGKSVILTSKNGNGNFITISGFTGGVGNLQFAYRTWAASGDCDKGTLQITVGSVTKEVEYSARDVAKIEEVAISSDGNTIDIKPKYVDATTSCTTPGRIVLDNIKWNAK